VSYALEFYSLSWDALKAALVQRKPALMTAIEERHWDKLLDDTDLSELDDEDDLRHPAGVIADAFDEIAEAMAQKLPPGHDLPGPASATMASAKRWRRGRSSASSTSIS